MVKVITYGTYDLLHYGHIRLLERAKALGDYLIVGVTADDFDKTRGKINVQQSLMERVEAVKATGLADEIVIEEYEGQKIDDIKKYDVDIFTVGSDWVGYFDYLNEFCKVVYLDRTQGVSSSEIRSKEADLRIGLIGDTIVINKFAQECNFVNGVTVTGIYTENTKLDNQGIENITRFESYDQLLSQSDAVYVASHPSKHYQHISLALKQGKHVIYEAPITLNRQEAEELQSLAEANHCILHEGIKTAYATAYSRLILLAKTGKIGEIVSVDTICTSLSGANINDNMAWNTMCWWAPTALLPVFDLLGTDYKLKQITSRMSKEIDNYDDFTKITFVYPHAIASIKIGSGVKSEGEMIISGTKGYIYVPSPWWKPDYFEIRYENFSENKRYFYQLDGEGIRYEIVAFVKAVQNSHYKTNVSTANTLAIATIMEDFCNRKDFIEI